MAIAAGHVIAHGLSESGARFTTASEHAMMDQIRHVTLGGVDLRRSNHMASLWRNHEREVTCVSEVASDLLNTITIREHMQATCLSVKIFSFFNFDSLGPLQCLDNSVLHIELANINKNFDALRK